MDVAYQTGVRRLIKIQSNREIKVEREDTSDDFSQTSPIDDIDDLPNFQSLQKSPWVDTLRSCSADFLQNSDVLFSKVTLEHTLETRRIVTTDGSTIREVRPHVRLSVYAQGVADDGMKLTTYDYIDAESMKTLTKEDCTQLINTASNTLSELLTAPVVDPFVGPAILRGKLRQCSFMRS